ncbi:MAG TPA: aminopeptidase, partial [Gaiellaceae bacterium]|nr:aminopeptidase [Gaiellaceae bacterium]
GVVFYDTLFDENAAAHIALGAAIVQCVEGADALSEEEQVAVGINNSSLHTDFMIGSVDVDVWGVSASGEEVPILKDGGWALS